MLILKFLLEFLKALKTQLTILSNVATEDEEKLQTFSGAAIKQRKENINERIKIKSYSNSSCFHLSVFFIARFSSIIFLPRKHLRNEEREHIFFGALHILLRLNILICLRDELLIRLSTAKRTRRREN